MDLFDFTSQWYFAFGPASKNSLIHQYCRENQFKYFEKSTLEILQENINQNLIIEGNSQLLKQAQVLKTAISVIFFGKDFSEEQLLIQNRYSQIGYCHHLIQLDYDCMRKILYPNIIFIYGPDAKQNQAASEALANNIDYTCILLPKNANNLIKGLKKTLNYVVQGLFTNQDEIKIIEKYFNIRIIHFIYNRNDFGDFNSFFDEQFKIIPILKQKSYYRPVEGSCHPVKVMDDVGIALCPQIIYINAQEESQKLYTQNYIKTTNGLLLNIDNINNICGDKNLPVASTMEHKVKKLTQIIFRNIDMKQVVLCNFPSETAEFIFFQGINRKIKKFVDLQNLNSYQYSKEYSSPIYYLQQQKWFHPNLKFPLKEQIQQKCNYWIVSGPGGCGRTTVAKYICNEYGYKHIQFESYLVTLKEKIAGPQDGEEIPIKKIIGHFASLIKTNPQITYLIDGLSYVGQDLINWLLEVGKPTIINLKVQQSELIRRIRKKNESDLAAQVSQEETTKIKQNLAKNLEFIDKINEICPESKIYQIDYNIAQLLSEQHIDSILKPRIYLIQQNNTLLYQNLAIKYDMGFINLNKIKLRDCATLLQKQKSRDIILCNYMKDQKLASQDLYWIQKYLGEVRYIALWQIESKEDQSSKMELHRPQKQEIQKQQDKQEEQKPPEDPPEQQQQKKIMDIYDYQWTQSKNHKNLSQWFFKLKKKIQQHNNKQQNCFHNFHQTIDTFNSNKISYIYETISD